ncbi:hypothetical protein C8R34_101141 [Nitrosomonas sp. Nm84]|nr:hypothetical protein C8R34_101141 [Nitrosomonas sp. Nm84]
MMLASEDTRGKIKGAPCVRVQTPFVIFAVKISYF